ncbi:MAG: hypothetical protein A3J93_00085 [Candidatus Magasanikbacteria bacterium RIFOXYC2_FULL_42_28]|uniref:EfeO-type cupredoxin-like domain-containing protein n=1 Tax=Candidatus Magasanikbacteria bacterium RIFOXYC2_FULL_42_28 TaxID=1798704 RepID=A0A1F6NW30_9BACT|nr:MAG: hypothetical protein A3J93_00085 [Candidatus Magasanikbacteria bacterium RIFOXYC2_FULL_42_28]
MNKYVVSLGGMVVALVIVGAGCASPVAEKTEAPEANEEAVETTMPALDDATVVLPEVQAEAQVEPITTEQPAVVAENAATFDVSGVNFAFDLKEIKVKKGQTITINFKSDMGFHDLVIDEFNVRTPQLKDPGTANVTFVADKVGTFEYYCSVGQHRVNGMVGNLIVE